MAMDVVDTLRHREQQVLRELDEEGREEELITRLREIYTAQGLEVSDKVLREGVRALRDRRFAYEPPAASFSVRLARLYVTRDRWLKPLMAGLVVIALALGVYQFTIAAPRKAKQEALRIELAQTLPSELTTLRDAIISNADEEIASSLAQTYYQQGLMAAENGNAAQARQAVDRLKTLRLDLAATYDVRVVYGPGEPRSGVFRIPDAAPQQRNFYLIVEAVDPTGRVLEVPVTSEEDQTMRRTSKWGQRVAERDFMAVSSDKQDDQIIQNAVIGHKPAGRLTPEYSVDTPGGAILEW